MRFFTLTLLVLAMGSANAQSAANTGTARSTGTCSLANSGSIQTVRIECGIGEDQGNKILHMLNELLSLNLQDQNKKIDEILDLLRKSLNPYGSSVTYDPSGTKKIVNPSTGVSRWVSDAEIEFFMPLQEKEKNKDWKGVLEIAQSAIEKYPDWFTPYFYLAEAQGAVCRPADAAVSFSKFLSISEGAEAYLDYRHDAKLLLEFLQDPRYKASCSAIGKTP